MMPNFICIECGEEVKRIGVSFRKTKKRAAGRWTADLVAEWYGVPHDRKGLQLTHPDCAKAHYDYLLNN